MSTFKNEQFESEAGAIILESAIFKFLSTSSVSERDQFALHIEKNEQSPTLVDELNTKFPRFGKILTEEMACMKLDASSLSEEDEEED